MARMVRATSWRPFVGAEMLWRRLGTAAIVVLLTVGAAVLAPALPVEAADFAVNSQTDAVDANPGDGVCATAALPNEGVRCTLRAAVMETNALAGPDTISLPSGTFEVKLTDSQSPCAICGLKIQGDLALRGSGPTSTTILYKSYVGRPMMTSEGAHVSIDGVTISGASHLSTQGIVLLSGTLRLTNVVVREHLSYEPQVTGAGIATSPGTTLDLSHVVLNNNTGRDGGGGLFNQGTATLDNVAILDNVAGFQLGGGNGGGILNASGAVLTVTNSVISGNSAWGTYGWHGCTAGGGAGGGLANAGSATVSNTVISNNLANETGGGGISQGSAGAQLALVNSTLTGNKIGYSCREADGSRPVGLAISGGGTVTVTNATMAGNTVNSPGARTITHEGDASFSIKNSIVSSGIDAPLCAGTIISLGHNLETGTTCGFTAPGDLQRTDPRIANLADNGGPTQTHKPLPGSPAIDAGDNAGCPTTDQRGRGRPADGDGNGNGAAVCDIGSFEAQPGEVAAVRVPRPVVGLQTARVGPGQVRGTLSVTRTEPLPANELSKIQVTRLDNATVTVNGAAATAGQAIPLAPGTLEAQVIVTRVAPGAFTARLSVTDGCGAWPTFLGGGSGVP